MKKNYLFIWAVLLPLCMGSCNNNTRKASSAITADSTTVVDTLSTVMTGTFHGVFPAASCEGIETTLTLRADSTYDYRQVYIGEKDGEFFTSGVYHLLNKDLVELVTPSSGEKTYFKRVDQGFMLSDSLGTINQGELAEHYILKAQ